MAPQPTSMRHQIFFVLNIVKKQDFKMEWRMSMEKMVDSGKIHFYTYEQMIIC